MSTHFVFNGLVITFHEYICTPIKDEFNCISCVVSFSCFIEMPIFFIKSSLIRIFLLAMNYTSTINLQFTIDYIGRNYASWCLVQGSHRIWAIYSESMQDLNIWDTMQCNFTNLLSFCCIFLFSYFPVQFLIYHDSLYFVYGRSGAMTMVQGVIYSN